MKTNQLFNLTTKVIGFLDGELKKEYLKLSLEKPSIQSFYKIFAMQTHRDSLEIFLDDLMVHYINKEQIDLGELDSELLSVLALFNTNKLQEVYSCLHCDMSLLCTQINDADKLIQRMNDNIEKLLNENAEEFQVLDQQIYLGRRIEGRKKLEIIHSLIEEKKKKR